MARQSSPTLLTIIVKGSQRSWAALWAWSAGGMGPIGAGTIVLRRAVVKGLTTAASIWAVGGGMFLAAGSATILALALLVPARPLRARMFLNRKEARRVRAVVERGPPLAGLREEIDAWEVPVERTGGPRPNSADGNDDAGFPAPRGRSR